MDEFERRLRMIEALEETKNDGLLSDLVAGDTGLGAYSSVLSRAACYLKDPALVKKLLTLPSLDPASDNYKRAVAGVFNEIAVNGKNPGKKICNLLFDRIKNDQEIKDRSLSLIFSSVAGSDMLQSASVNAELGTWLVKSGANVKSAQEYQKKQIEQEQKIIDQRRKNLLAFTRKITKP